MQTDRTKIRGDSAVELTGPQGVESHHLFELIIFSDGVTDQKLLHLETVKLNWRVSQNTNVKWFNKTRVNL